MKKSILLALSLSALALVACDNSGEPTPENTSNEVSETSQASEASIEEITSEDKLSSIEDISSSKEEASGIEDITSEEISSSINFSSEEITSEEEPGAWSDKIAEFIYDNLNGLVLPYFHFEGLTVSSVPDLAGCPHLVIQAPSIEDGDLNEIATLFDADGWDVEDTSAHDGGPAGSSWEFTKVVQDAFGTSAEIMIYSYGIDYVNGVSTYSTSGQLYFEAFIQDYLSWPMKVAIQFAQEAGRRTNQTIPPTVPADHYAVSFTSRYIDCFYEDTSGNDDGGYSAIIGAKGWNVLEEPDPFGYIIAVSPDQNYQVSYLYSGIEECLRLCFEYYDGPFDEWREYNIENFFLEWENYPWDVPEFESENGKYYFTENEDNNLAYENSAWDNFYGIVAIKGVTSSEIHTYNVDIFNDGWESQGYENGYEILTLEENGRIYTIRTKSYEENEVLCFEIQYLYEFSDAPGTSSWPSDDEIKEWLEESIPGTVNDILPSYDVFGVSYDFGASVIFVYLPANYEGDPKAEYEAILTDPSNGFVGDGGLYHSPNGEYDVSVAYWDEEHILYINIRQPIVYTDQFPLELVGSALPGVTDEIVSLDGATSYNSLASRADEDYCISVGCSYLRTGLDPEVIINDYYALLVTKGFTPMEDYDDYYQSPNGQYAVSLSIGTDSRPDLDWFILDLYFDNIVDGVV